MKIAVIGLWHLGCVTAACLAQGGHTVTGYDKNQQTIQNLQKGQAPLFEPGLNELISKSQAAQQLEFTNDPNTLTQAEIIWVTIDTPVDDDDIADVDLVMNEIKSIIPFTKSNALMVISSQLPVGSIRSLLRYSSEHYADKHITFACSPENLRLGKAIVNFSQPDRIIMGLQTQADTARVAALLKPFSDNIVFMSIESAEMTKHALNAFLATSVVFINELATLCEKVGANAREVERGLKSEERIGHKAYLRPGNAIAGGTLARDVNFLTQIGREQNQPTPLFSSLLTSNAAHKQWSCNKLSEVLINLKNKKVTTLGLTYKSGTDTLRRSSAVETCEWLNEQGVDVIAYDPSLVCLPLELSQFIDLKPTLAEALQGTDAIVVATEWPEFSSLKAEDLLACNGTPLVFDPSGFLAKNLSQDSRIKYFSVGM